MSVDKSHKIANPQSWLSNQKVVYIGHDSVRVWFGVVEDNDGPIDPPIITRVRLLTDAENFKVRHGIRFVPAASAYNAAGD